jgi:phenylpyruvate tautomerase PptA (4-oxalocrotonate tautomerase family)
VPVVRIDVAGPKSAEYRSALLAGVRAGVLAGLGVPDERVTVRLFETAAGDFDLPACRTERYTIVDVTMYAGRTPDLKAACIAAVRERLAENPGIEPSEVTVVFHDLTPTDLDVPPGEAG